MNHAINAGMETISCGAGNRCLQGVHDCFHLPHEFLGGRNKYFGRRENRQCGAALRALQDLSEIQLESGQDGIAAKDRWVFNSCGWLAGTVDHCAFIERIQ